MCNSGTLFGSHILAIDQSQWHEKQKIQISFTTMKSKILILLGVMLCMIACSDSSAVRDAKGAYRFKTTGKVTLEENFEGATKGDTLVANLDNESGTLEIVSLHDGDSLLMTIDQLNGDVNVTRGIIKNGRLSFAQYSRTLEVPLDVTYYDTITIGIGVLSKDSVISYVRHEYEMFDIVVSGYADVYDNNLVFTLGYKGKSQTSERTLRGEGISCLAKKN